MYIHFLHVSWSNILLNPCQISGTPKRLAKEQPASFAKFLDPSNRETIQNCSINCLVTQYVGTAALLDLELAIELDPTKGARGGVDTMFVSVLTWIIFSEFVFSLGYTNVYCYGSVMHL